MLYTTKKSNTTHLQRAHDMHTRPHLFVQPDLLYIGCGGHESQESAKLLPAARALQLQAQLQGLQSLLLLSVHWQQTEE